MGDWLPSLWWVAFWAFSALVKRLAEEMPSSGLGQLSTCLLWWFGHQGRSQLRKVLLLIGHTRSWWQRLGESLQRLGAR